jgi:hypothetical protein
MLNKRKTSHIEHDIGYEKRNAMILASEDAWMGQVDKSKV